MRSMPATYTVSKLLLMAQHVDLRCHTTHFVDFVESCHSGLGLALDLVMSI